MAVTPTELQTILRGLNERGGSHHILAAGVAKVLLASPDNTKIYAAEQGSFLRRFPNLSTISWTDTGLQGVLVLVYDSADCILSLKMFSIKKLLSGEARCLFSYELYYEFAYVRLSEELYCFEIDDCVMGILFNAGDVAYTFYSKVDEVTRQQAQQGTTHAGSRNGSFSTFNNLTNSVEFRSPSVATPAVRPNAPFSPSLNYSSQLPNSQARIRQNSMAGANLKLGTTSKSKGKQKKKGKMFKIKPKGQKGNSSFQNFFAKKKEKQGISSKLSDLSYSSEVGAATGRSSPITRAPWTNASRRKLPKRVDASNKNIIPPQRATRIGGVSVNLDNEGFATVDPNALPPEWKNTFRKAGIKKRDLLDPVVASTIIDTLQIQDLSLQYEENGVSGVSANEMRAFAMHNREELSKYYEELNEYEYKKDQYDAYVASKNRLGKWEKEQKPKVQKRVKKNNRKYDKFKNHNESMFDEGAEPGLFDAAVQSRIGTTSSFKEVDKLSSFEDLASKAPVSQLKTTAGSFSRVPPPTPARSRNSPSRTELSKSEGIFGSFDSSFVDFPPPPSISVEIKAPPPPPQRKPKLPAFDRNSFNQVDEKPLGTKPAPIFLGQIGKKRQLAHVSSADAYMQTMQRLKKKMVDNPGAQNSLVRKLKAAIGNRRELVREGDSDSDSEWS
eukprot:maker-scaffold_5-snap-gene-4.4-mRNA-1 protein AED:0.00 eAED:0.00 QI:219/1/1/1/1/1/2/66/669